MLIPFLGIIVSLCFLVVMAYRGHSVIVFAPLAALIAILFSSAPIMGTYTQIFMPALGNFITKYFPLFLFGAIFGHLMTKTGLAAKLAHGISALFGPKRALLSTVIATTLLTYGGVSAWVVAFTIVPIASALFRQANVPKRLMPAALALGTITFALAALPGSPQIHNAIPTTYFATDTYAAPVFGGLSAAIMLIAGILWLEFRLRRLRAHNENYLPDGEYDDQVNNNLSENNSADPSAQESRTTTKKNSVAVDGFQGLLPILVVIVANFSFVYYFSGKLETAYLAEEKYGSTSLQSLLGVWSPTIALAAAIATIVLMQPRKIVETVKEFSEGAKTALLPCFTTASEVGYGAVIASLAVFGVVKSNMLEISDNALIVSAVSAAVISGITGSSSGGLSITMETLGDQLAELAAAQGISAELMHRVTAMASVSFDSLPHNGAVLTILIVCGMTHRKSYKDLGVVTVIIPLVTLLVMLGVHVIVPALL